MEEQKMNKEEKCIVIFEGTFNEGMAGSDEQKEYTKKSTANAEVYGGFIGLSNYTFEQNLGNGLLPHFIVIVEYQSKEKFIQSLNSEEYLSIISLRDLVFKEVKILLTKN